MACSGCWPRWAASTSRSTSDVKGKVTLRLDRVPWDQALDAVLRMHGLEARRDGPRAAHRQRGAPRAGARGDRRRRGGRRARAARRSRLASLPVRWARADDALAEKVQGVLSERGSVTVRRAHQHPPGARPARRRCATPRHWCARSTSRARRSSSNRASSRRREDFARGARRPVGLSLHGRPGDGRRHGRSSRAARARQPLVADFPVPATLRLGLRSRRGGRARPGARLARRRERPRGPLDRSGGGGQG